MRDLEARQQRRNELAHAASLPEGFELKELSCAWCGTKKPVTKDTTKVDVEIFVQRHNGCRGVRDKSVLNYWRD